MNNKYELGAFILRLVTGLTFLLHGLSKFQGGIENTVGFFSSVGIPGFLAYIVAIIELAGGALMILGLGTRVIGLLFAIVMLGPFSLLSYPPDSWERMEAQAMNLM